MDPVIALLQGELTTTANEQLEQDTTTSTDKNDSDDDFEVVVPTDFTKPPSPSWFAQCSKLIISPLGDESINGYPGDKEPDKFGIDLIKDAVKLIEEAGSSCCLVGEAALIYYGARRIREDWQLCVPTENLERIADVFRACTDVYEPFRPRICEMPGSLYPFFPRFKVRGFRFFFNLLSSQCCHMPCTPDTIERSHLGLPYPTLPAFAQSLLDTCNRVDLDDLIDGMDLTVEWGEEHLELEGQTDMEWERWKRGIQSSVKAPPGEIRISDWRERFPLRRNIWTTKTTSDAKIKRIGFKREVKPNHVTRFRKRGSKDLRSRGGLSAGTLPDHAQKSSEQVPGSHKKIDAVP